MESKNRIFYGEANKGFILKVTVDTLNGPVQRGYFVIDKDGIRLRQTDEENTVLYDISFPRKHIKGFICTRPITISVNLKHMQTLLKNVKKKDSVAMFINSDSPDKFFITIRPEGARKNTRFETNSIIYQEETKYEMQPLPEGGYGHPMVIEGSDFQKIKRLTSVGKIINVSIQDDNYLSFRCDAGVIFDSELGFGELRTSEQSYQNPSRPPPDSITTCSCGKVPKKCFCTCERCGEYLCDCSCVCDRQGQGCGEWLAECVCKCPDCEQHITECNCQPTNSEDVQGLFSAQYYSRILAKLVKLPGLCTQMQFYAPTIPGFPLKIEVNASQGGFTFGTIQVFIKDVSRIAYEESIKGEEDRIIVKSTKGKSRRKV